MTEAALRVPDAHDRKDLGTFLARVSQLDESAVVRLRARDDGRVVIWAATQFDVLACRAVRGELRTPDITAAVDEVLRGLQSPDADGYVHTGYPMDSVWRGALPADNGFEYLDDIPARSVLELAQRGESWHASTAAPTGRRYRCLISRLSRSTEPAASRLTCLCVASLL